MRDRPKGLSNAKGEPQARVTAGNGNFECKTMSRRTEIAYRAWFSGKSAQHDKTKGFVKQGILQGVSFKQLKGVQHVILSKTDI